MPSAWIDACGVCPTCLRIAAGQHADVTLIERGSEASIKIRTIRERLLDTVGYRPFEARRRVYIIDGADNLTTEAQDALLKTLEEPPSAALLILVTAYPDTLLGTIQSRCRRLRFGGLSAEDVVRVLVERAGLEPSRARTLAGISGGSVSTALAAAEGDIEDDQKAALALLEAVTSGPVVSRLGAASSLTRHTSKRRDRETLSARLAIVASLVRDLGVLTAGGSATLSNVDSGGAAWAVGEKLRCRAGHGRVRVPRPRPARPRPQRQPQDCRRLGRTRTLTRVK